MTLFILTIEQWEMIAEASLIVGWIAIFAIPVIEWLTELRP